MGRIQPTLRRVGNGRRNDPKKSACMPRRSGKPFAGPARTKAPGHRVRCERPSPGASRANRSTTSSDPDRKSTRLNSSHGYISYAVFCLKKKKKKKTNNNEHSKHKKDTKLEHYSH